MTDGGMHAIDAASVNGTDAEAFYRLGVQCAAGAEAAPDYVAAHMWFNIAAMRGCAEALRRRRELAELMSESEIATAQRAARDWLKPKVPLRAA